MDMLIYIFRSYSLENTCPRSDHTSQASVGGGSRATRDLARMRRNGRFFFAFVFVESAAAAEEVLLLVL